MGYINAYVVLEFKVNMSMKAKFSAVKKTACFFESSGHDLGCIQHVFIQL